MVSTTAIANWAPPPAKRPCPWFGIQTTPLMIVITPCFRPTCTSVYLRTLKSEVSGWDHALEFQVFRTNVQLFVSSLCVLLATTQNAASPSLACLQKQRPRNGHQATVDVGLYRPIQRSSFALRRGRYLASSWLAWVPSLGNEERTRTIEMILVSTVLPRWMHSIRFMWCYNINIVGSHTQNEQQTSLDVTTHSALMPDYDDVLNVLE